MDGVRMPMERTAALLKWKVVGEVPVPGVFVEGDIEKPMAVHKRPLLLKTSDYRPSV